MSRRAVSFPKNQARNVTDKGTAQNPPRASVRLGDLVAIAFDQAMKITRDPRRAAELATLAVQRVLRQAGQGRLVKRLATT